MADYDNVQAVQRMQDYIEAHIGETITLDDLSKAAEYSRSHSLRVFKKTTGFTPFEYIRRYRLTRGARHLRDGGVKVADVACLCAFDTHEGFTRAFSKEFGLSPETYREGPVPLRYFIPYSGLIRYLVKNKSDHMEKRQKQTIFVQVIERPKRKAIIKRGFKAEDYYAHCEEAGCDVWGVLESIEAPYEPVGFWLPPKLIKKDTSKYVLGVEIPSDYKGEVPEGYDVIDLDPCKFMVFQGEPFNDENFEEAIGDIWDVMKGYDPSLQGFEWADADAPRFQLAPIGSRGYIEARPVKALKK